jgi:NAD+ synthase (glutamine-hydrolysing)
MIIIRTGFMKLIKLGAGVLNQTPLDWEHNFRNIAAAIENAKSQDISILCLPELCITGYGCEDAFYSPNTFEKALEYLQKIVPHTQGIVVSVGLPLLVQNKAFNCACLIADGHILGFVAKKFLAGNGIHYEPRWFTAWTQDGYTITKINGKEYKIGNIYFDLNGIKVGFEICEDAWVANRPGRELYMHGIDILLNPSASHFAFDKINVRKRFVLEGSRAFGVSYVYANLLGNEAGRAIYDGGGIIASNGTLLAIGERLSFADFNITAAVVDVDLCRIAQMQSHSYSVAENFGNCIHFNFDFPDLKPQQNFPKEPKWESSDFIKEEEFARAMMLGLFDYLRKSYSNGFVISLWSR